MKKTKKSKKRLKCANELAKVITGYYQDCHEAKLNGVPAGKKITLRLPSL